MSKRKNTPEAIAEPVELPATEPAQATPAARQTALPVQTSDIGQQRQSGDEPAEAAQPAQGHAAIEAPPRGEGRAYTIDNRLGYRKEESPDGRRRQIRFSDRQGGRPDDETLAPVRNKKPQVSWAGYEKAWQARKNSEGLQAIDLADQELAELGRKRTGSPAR